METDRIALALEHGAFQIVVEQHARQTTPCVKRRDVATQEVCHLRIEVEAQEDRARVAQDHHERHQRALGATDGELANVAPLCRQTDYAEFW